MSGIRNWRRLLPPLLLGPILGWASCAFAGYPSKLLDWPLFQFADNHLSLHPDAVPYDLQNPLFSDYASKFRVILLPKDQVITYRSEGVLDFPVGTVIAKTFAYPKTAVQFPDGYADPLRRDLGYPLGGYLQKLEGYFLVETRLLIREATGWVGLPYLWDADQKNAKLQLPGKRISLSLKVGDRVENFAYKVPNFNQCRSCHLQMDGFEKKVLPIGPTAQHLNRTYSYSEGESHQLQYLADKGLLAGLPPLEQVPHEPRVEDHSATLELRARAYLGINCAHCHNPKGPASPSGLFLTYDNPNRTSYGICKSPVATGNAGTAFRYDIVPGKPGESILLHRLISLDPGIMMPEVGRSLVHREGADLIAQWIFNLDGSCP